MKYRIMKHTRGKEVWFTAERQFLFFFWRTCFRDGNLGPAKYGDVEQARRYIENHKLFNAKEKVERILTL